MCFLFIKCCRLIYFHVVFRKVILYIKGLLNQRSAIRIISSTSHLRNTTIRSKKVVNVLKEFKIKKYTPFLECGVYLVVSTGDAL